MVAVQILYQGTDDITADVRFETARFMTAAGGVPGEFQISVKDLTHSLYPPGYFHTGGTLELFIDGRREWDGWVIGVSREYAFPVDNTEDPTATPRYWALDGYDRNLLFSRRFTFDQANPDNLFIGSYPADTSDAFIVTDMATNYLSIEDDDIDVVSGVIPVGSVDPYQPVNVFESGMPWGTAMNFVSMYNGAIYYIDPDRILRYVDDTTETAPFALSDEPVAGEVGYRDATIHFDATEMYNEAFVWGVGVGSPDPVVGHVIDEDAVNEHGLFQFAEFVQGIYKQLSADRRADIAINGSPSHNRGHKLDVVRIESTIFTPGLRVGMGVSYHSGSWDFGGDLAVGNDDYTPVPGTSGTLFDRFLAQLRHIESNSNYDPHHQNRRTGAMGAYQIMPANWRVWGPLALGYPRSSGVATRDLDVDSWFPPPTAANQETVARWRIGLLYQHKGDFRRVAASWRSGPSVGSRQPSTWSRGTIFYVNHACVPIGFPVTTTATIIGDEPEPDLSRGDYQEPVTSDDVYPVRKMEMTFPTPTSVKFELLLSHQYDAFWAYHDPIPRLPGDPNPTGDWFSEQIMIDLGIGAIPGDGDGPPPPAPELTGDAIDITLFGTWGIRYGSAGLQSGSGLNPPIGGLGLYSSAGIEHGFAAGVPWYDTNCGIGPGGWEGVETAQVWYPLPILAIASGLDEHGVLVHQTLADINQAYPLETTVNVSLGSLSGAPQGVTISLSGSGPTDWLASDEGQRDPLGAGRVIATQVYQPSAADSNWAAPVSFPTGTLRSTDRWLIVSPSWRAAAPGEYVCDDGSPDPLHPGHNCFGSGPRCTGWGNSGVFALTASPSVSLGVVGWPNSPTGPDAWSSNPSDTSQNDPQASGISTGTFSGTYRTLYPYAPNTLQVSYEGIQLSGGQLVEVDPGHGIFTIMGLDGLSGQGLLTLRYYRPADSQPTDALPGEPGGIPTGTSSDAIEAVIRQAYSFLHTPYRLGAESRVETDCSGLVFQCFRDAGYGALVGTTRKLASGYTRYFADRGMFSRSMASAQRGDLISFGNPSNTKVVHIGIYLGGGMMISALVNPWGVSKTTVTGIHEPIYGVCMVPYENVRTSSDTTDASASDPEETQSPSDTLPPQTTPPSGQAYRPRPQHMLGWGTQYDGRNATMACSAMLLERHTIGAHNDLVGSPLSTPPSHRTHSAVTTEGTIADAGHAWTTGFGETMVTVDSTVGFEYLKTLINEGRGAMVQGLATVLPDSLRRTTSTTTHCLYVNEQLDDGTFWVVDPYDGRPALYPESVLYAFATSLANGEDNVTCGLSRRTALL